MTPHYQDPWLTVYHGDARAVMAEMEPESVHCVVTSPPYWGLRDYGQPEQLGLEPTPEAYVESMVAVFREVRRVLRADGTVWLVLGDSYATHPKGNTKPRAEQGNGAGRYNLDAGKSQEHWQGHGYGRVKVAGMKEKDLVGIPWRVAFALQADGWYLRSDIIWSKPNPMPESVTDRPTKSHEYLFLLSKKATYYFDADAVREAQDQASVARYAYGFNKTGKGLDLPGGASHSKGNGADGGSIDPNPAGRNIRSVWTVATAPYPGAHFATFPPKLIEPCIKAGTSERGVCPECGAPWEREIGRDQLAGDYPAYGDDYRVGAGTRNGIAGRKANPHGGSTMARYRSTTTGWQPSCRHSTFARPIGDEDLTKSHPTMYSAPIPATVLDPFAGSGTTGMVAQSLSRRAVLIDLSMDYLGQLMDRNRDIPLGLGA